jgi:hypothetical protein
MYAYMFRLTIVAIIREPSSTDMRSVQYMLPFSDIMYAAHVCGRWLPDYGYDG